MTSDRAGAVALIARRTIRASVDRVFEAWTNPGHLRKWWGPADVTCTEAEVELRVGGAIRIANALPTGDVLWIVGAFEKVAPPRELVYTWRLEPGDEPESRVTVKFEPRDGATEVVVIHEQIATEAARASHEAGWLGCLDGLAALFAA